MGAVVNGAEHYECVGTALAEERKRLVAENKRLIEENSRLQREIDLFLRMTRRLVFIQDVIG